MRLLSNPSRMFFMIPTCPVLYLSQSQSGKFSTTITKAPTFIDNLNLTLPKGNISTVTTNKYPVKEIFSIHTFLFGYNTNGSIFKTGCLRIYYCYHISDYHVNSFMWPKFFPREQFTLNFPNLVSPNISLS